MSNELVTVLDLGSTKAVCLAAHPTESGAIEVVAMAQTPCKGLKRGVVADLDETSQAVAEVTRKVESALGEPLGDVFVSIGGAHVEGVNSQGFVPITPSTKPISTDDVLRVVNHSRQLMMPPDREQIQAIPREFRVNGQRNIARPVGMSGSKLEVMTYIVTGHSPNIQNLERALQMADRNVAAMVLMPLASGLGVLTKQDLELGCVVVDIGGGTTDVAVFSGGSIAYHACIPIGGQLVTSDLSKLLKCSPEEAERLKIKYGSAFARTVPEADGIDVQQIGQEHARPMQRRVFSEIIESRMRELAVMVRQQIEKSGLFGVLPGGVVLAGGGSVLPATDALFEEVFQHLRVRKGTPKVEGQLKHTIARPELATAVGLARFAMEHPDDDLSPGMDEAGWKQRVRSLWTLFGGKG